MPARSCLTTRKQSCLPSLRVRVAKLHTPTVPPRPLLVPLPVLTFCAPHNPTGSRIQKRPLPRRGNLASTPIAGHVDVDGYRTPAGRAPTCVHVSTKAPFMSIVKRVRKALDNGPQKTKGLPLLARVAALSTGSVSATAAAATNDDANVDGAGKAGAEVLVLGTGRAIEKTLNVAAFFNRQKDCRVSLRTRTIGAVDDVIMGEAEGGDDEEAEEDQARVRMVSCLEVVVRLR